MNAHDWDSNSNTSAPHSFDGSSPYDATADAYWSVDFGSDVSVEGFRIKEMGSRCPDKAQLEYSDDGTNWTLATGASFDIEGTRGACTADAITNSGDYSP